MEFRLNRVFSRPLTRFLLLTPLTPNQITTLSMLLGLGGGLLFSLGRTVPAIEGAFLYQLAVVLDNCDGEVARAKNKSSRFGARYDIAADFVTDLSLFSGVTLGALRAREEGPVVLFAALALSGALMHLVLIILEKSKGFGPSVFNAPHPEHDKRKNPFLTFFDMLREGDASWFVVLFALCGKTVWLLWLGGIYMQLLWLTALAVNFRWLVNPKKAGLG